MQINVPPLDVNEQNYSFFRYSSLKHALITAVALTCLFIGIVSLLSLHPMGLSIGLSSISQIGLYLCIPSLVLGLLALSYSVISICYRKSFIITTLPLVEISEQNSEDSEDSSDLQIITQQNEENLHVDDDLTCNEKKITLEEFLKKIEEEYEKGVLAQIHFNNYSRLNPEDKCLIPTLESFPQEIPSSAFTQYRLLFQLIYMSDEGILSLPLYVVKIISQNSIGKQILSKRLLIIEKYEELSDFEVKKQLNFNVASVQCSSFDKHSLLFFFRDIDISKIEITDEIILFLCFLNSSKLLSFLNNQSPSLKLLNACFPIDQIEYTAFKLKKLSLNDILKYKDYSPVNFLLFFNYLDHSLFPWNNFIKQKNIGQVLHQRPELKYGPNFPWHILIKDPIEIAAFFNIESKAHVKHTRMILEKLDIQAIKNIGEYLSIKHLRLFSLKQLSLPEFPWEAFLTKEGIALELRLLSKDVIKLEHIPWQNLKDASEINLLFDISSDSKKPATKAILVSMHLLGVCTFAQHLSIEHFYFFSTKQLLNSNFPWKDFLHYKGISQALKKRPVDIFACNSFPWDFFVSKNLEEFKILFSLKNGSNPYIIKSIINNLKMHAIVSVANKLSSKFILFFSEEQLLEKNFPWEIFFAKKNIGKYLRQFDHSFFTSKEIPWEKLKQNPLALSQFLSTEKSELELTKKIFELVNNDEKKLDLIFKEETKN